jgi:putative membrane protein
MLSGYALGCPCGTRPDAAAGHASQNRSAITMTSLKILAWVLLLAGLAVMTGLVAWHGFGEVAATIARGGWAMLLPSLVFIPQCVTFAIAWQLLFPPGRAPGFVRAFYGTAVGIYANSLLPMAEVGGEIIKARIVMKGGTSGVDAGASVVLDKTVQTITLVAWAVVGIAALIALDARGPTVYAGIAVVAALTAGLTGFIIVQHRGMFGSMAGLGARLTGSETWVRLAGSGRALDEAIRELYRHRMRITGACLIRLVGRVILVGEIWFVAQLIGHPISMLEALALRSLGITIRSAAFVVPGGYGVQEGGYVAIGALLGIPPEIALVLSLASRIRDIVVGVPALAVWQLSEGHGLRKRAAALTSGTSRATGGDG